MTLAEELIQLEAIPRCDKGTVTLHNRHSGAVITIDGRGFITLHPAGQRVGYVPYWEREDETTMYVIEGTWPADSDYDPTFTAWEPVSSIPIG